jgi:hypothetical protein
MEIHQRTNGHQNPAVMPTDVSMRLGLFDRFAGWAAQLVGRAFFFSFCVILVVVWLPTIFVMHDIDTWQLVINTVTTIITFLMVALLENTHTRSDRAIQHKLNAIADGLADLMANLQASGTTPGIQQDLVELRAAVGLETHESSS